MNVRSASDGEMGTGGPSVQGPVQSCGILRQRRAAESDRQLGVATVTAEAFAAAMAAVDETRRLLCAALVNDVWTCGDAVRVPPRHADPARPSPPPETIRALRPTQNESRDVFVRFA